MKRIYQLLIIVALLAFAVGCEENVTEKEPGIVGYVMNKSDQGILVVSTEAQDFSETGGVSEFYDAIWFSGEAEDIGKISVGDKVKVWYDVVMESYPGQSTAERIEVIPSAQPEGANLTEAQAIANALKDEQLEESNPYAVKAISYIQNEGIWKVELKGLLTDKDEIKEILVKDQK